MARFLVALLLAFVLAVSSPTVSGAGSRKPHSQLAEAVGKHRLVHKMVLEGQSKFPIPQLRQVLYDMYVDKECTREEVWDALEYFKIPTLPKLNGVDKRYLQIVNTLEAELRHEEASNAAGEDHEEYVTHETHKLYKKYGIEPQWPKSITKKRHPEKGFAKVKKDDL